MTQEALKLALEELANRFSEGWHEGIKIDASDIMLLSEAAEALSQTEQEPVAWMDADGKTFPFVWNVSSLGVQQGSKYLDETLTPLYTTPPQRQWKELTNEELTDLFYNTNLGQQSAVLQAIAKLKQKNGFTKENT